MKCLLELDLVCTWVCIRPSFRHIHILNLTVWEAQPDERSIIQHESSRESNWEPLHTACKLALGYFSLSFFGKITPTVDWLYVLDMFGNFICSYCRHNKLVGHILTGSASLLDFVSSCNWHIMGSKPISNVFFGLHSESWEGYPGVSAGITSMCLHLWSRASPNSVAWRLQELENQQGSSAGCPQTWRFMGNQ